MKMKEVKFKQWTRKIKEWTVMLYLRSENYIAYGILPPSNTIMEELIGAPRAVEQPGFWSPYPPQ